MKTRPARRLPSGFTLVEILIASAATLMLIAGVYTLVYCANVLTAKNYATNSTGTEAHNTLDQLQGTLQTAYTLPKPIDTTGIVSGSTSITGTTAVATGLMSAMGAVSTGTITSMSPGIRFYRVVGGPYLVTIPTGGLPTTATSVTIQLDNSALPAPPVPQANDILLINTTAVPTSFQDWAMVSATPSVASTSGSRVTYSVSLTPPMKGNGDGGAGANIPYQTDNKNNAIACSATLLRLTAFIIVTNGSNKELRMFDPCTTDSNGNVVLTGSNYRTLTRAIDTGTSTLSQFGTVSMGGQSFASLVLRIRSTDYDNYLAKKQNDGFCTYMGFSALIALKSKP